MKTKIRILATKKHKLAIIRMVDSTAHARMATRLSKGIPVSALSKMLAKLKLIRVMTSKHVKILRETMMELILVHGLILVMVTAVGISPSRLVWLKTTEVPYVSVTKSTKHILTMVAAAPTAKLKVVNLPTTPLSNVML